MSANVQFAEVSGRPGDGRPGTSAPTNGGEAGGVVGDGPGGVIGDGLGGGMVGRDVLGAPPPSNGLCTVTKRAVRRHGTDFGI